jgi:hypothetical protein
MAKPTCKDPVATGNGSCLVFAVQARMADMVGSASAISGWFTDAHLLAGSGPSRTFTCSIFVR